MSTTHTLDKKVETLQSQVKKLQQKVTELELVVQIRSLLSHRLDRDETLQSIQHFFLTNFHIHHFSLLLRNGSEKDFIIALRSGNILSETTEYSTKDKTSLPHYFIAHKAPLYVPDISKKSPVNLDGIVESPAGSLLSIRLNSEKQKMLGIITLHNQEPGAFSQRDINTLQEVAPEIAKIIQKALLFHTTKELAYTDQLTSVFNRRYFDQRYSREILRARRYKRTLAILMVDIDHFKVYNDTFGHMMGDVVLRKAAQLFETSLRRADVVCRYGGEEFVIILPEINPDHAGYVAEKLRQAVIDMAFIGEENMPNHQVTISIGVASFPQNGETAEDVLEQADLSLYKAKNTGRNKVVVASH